MHINTVNIRYVQLNIIAIAETYTYRFIMYTKKRINIRAPTH